MRLLRNFIIGLVLTILAIAALMLIPSPQPASFKPWEVEIMPDGQARVLGIHLGTTPYNEAQKKLNVFGDLALFTDPDGTISVEAFFESVNLGGLSAKLVLGLDLSESEMKEMLQRASAGMLQPSMAKQHEISLKDHPLVHTAAVKNITYIPTVRLSEAMLIERFGNPSTKEEIESEPGASRWIYPALNMEARLKPSHKTVLLYTTK